MLARPAEAGNEIDIEQGVSLNTVLLIAFP